jgi:hypothetical protein
MKSARFPVTLVALSTLAGCDGQNVSPSRISTAPSPQVTEGQITLQSISPPSGATLPVEECQFYPSRLDLDFWEMCADQLNMTVDVEFEADVRDAVVTAGFYRGTQRCGLAMSQTKPLRAGRTAVFDTHVILLSDETTQLPCALPAETTQMVVQLWGRSSPATVLLRREFAHHYRFAEP